DYLPKPVHAPVLLDKIRQQLTLDWVRRDAGATASVAAALPFDALHALQQQASLGYVRGVLELLDQLERDLPAAAAQLQELRQLARRFQLNELGQRLDQAITNDTQATMENTHA